MFTLLNLSVIFYFLLNTSFIIYNIFFTIVSFFFSFFSFFCVCVCNNWVITLLPVRIVVDESWDISGLKMLGLDKSATGSWENKQKLRGDRWMLVKNPPMMKLVSDWKCKLSFRKTESITLSLACAYIVCGKRLLVW